MNITHYFLEIGHCNALKSALHKAIYHYLISLSGKLFSASEFDTTTKEIIKNIELLNSQFPRHKAVKASFIKFNQEKHYFSGIQEITFYIKPAELIYSTNIKMGNN